jgi:non-specific serine/threonine protein kinase
VANRVLQVRIHDLDNEDIKLCESILGGEMRGVEFIYKEAGVNRSLSPKDREEKNLNNTSYRNQINKVALAIMEIISGLKKEPIEPVSEIKGAVSIEEKPLIKEKSIIVLPFENISPDPDQEYFSDGLTEEIITDLSHIRDLLVISRSSAMTFKGTNKKIGEIAKEVNVRYVLEGSVRKAGNNLRISAQLIDGLNDSHIWAEKYSGTLDDIFDIQEKVSRAIVGSLKLKLTANEIQKIASSPIPNIYAYECFLKARYEILKWTEEGLNNALILLQRGLDLVGENAVLLAGMGYAYYQFRNTGFRMDEITLQKAEEYSKQALTIDPESPTAHVVLALLQIWNGKRREAIDHLKQAIFFDPNNFDALFWFTGYCLALGKIKTTWHLMERLVRLEPLNPVVLAFCGLEYAWEGKFEMALNHMRNAYKNYPDDLLVRFFLSLTLLSCNSVEEADLIIDRFIKDAPEDMNAKMVFTMSLAFRHNTAAALSILKDPKMEAWARPDLWASFFISESYALHDLKDEAIDWLENAVNLGFLNYPFLNDYDPFLKNIRSEERFKKLMERVKYEWENFEV